jgi:membrane protease YdiL (CAAX protease family)
LLVQQLSFSPLYLLYGLALALVMRGYLRAYRSVCGHLAPSACLEYRPVQQGDQEEENEQTAFTAVVGPSLVALGEELCFRGSFQPFFGLLLTSVLFALTHWTSMEKRKAGLLHAVFAFGGGSLLGCSVMYFENLWPAIIGHFLHNMWIARPWAKPMFLKRQ